MDVGVAWEALEVVEVVDVVEVVCMEDVEVVEVVLEVLDVVVVFEEPPERTPRYTAAPATTRSTMIITETTARPTAGRPLSCKRPLTVELRFKR